MNHKYLAYSFCRNMLTAVLLLTAGVMAATANDIHVATTGSDANDGSEGAPLLTIHKAMEIVQAGDRILVHEGTYNITERIKIPELPTSPERRCELRAWPDDAAGKVIIDGSGMKHTTEAAFKMGRCIYVNHLANYWTFYGLVLQHAEDNGMKVEGSYNVIERCTFRWNNDTGLQIGMFKDWKIEETKSFPISGQPEFNPGYTYCRYNKVINCDAYENADAKTYNGNDDYGDADGFACKLFPGPGTEFHGCRAWTNSDDNWDLYMVYHPIVIDHCWAYNAGRTTDGREVGNGNGFKLGGGGTAGGAAFDQSTGAHVVTNCVSFNNLHKGFDQNNAYEGMYIINCTAWGNQYNYRFPTIFKYGGMVIRNCIGWGATEKKDGVAIGNHEFLSPDKEGYQLPDTEYNSWTTIDRCSPIKEGYKEGKTQIVTKDHAGEFLSLAVADFMAPREDDGSLPDNNFARLKPNSIMKDMGTPIIGFTPKRFMTMAEATSHGLELITADDLYLPYNDEAPDFGAFELDGIPATFTIPEKIEVLCKTANSVQEIIAGQAISDIVYEANAVAQDATVTGLADGLSYTFENQQLTISGTPAAGCTFTVTFTGDESAGVKSYTTTGIVSLVTPYKVLTGDWYHFQNAAEALPDDLQHVLELIDGDHTDAAKAATTIDTQKEESGCSFSKGAVCLGQSNGGIKLNLSNGVLQLRLNLFFTGGREFKISYTMADGTTKSVTTSKLSKGAYGEWDVLANAGVTSEAEGADIRSITFAQSGANGGARIYDMYVRVPDAGLTAITDVKGSENGNRTRKFLQQGRLVILKGGVRYNAVGQKL